MFVAPTITSHPSVYPCLWHILLRVILLFTTILSVVVHVSGTYNYLSSFCLSTILIVVIHVCATYYYLSSFCLSTILNVLIHVCGTHYYL